ncbi:MAG: response regulator [Gemmataceae bacterium]
MLVLSRRPDEKIVFPQIGVTIHVLRNNGSAVRLGIDAPRHLQIVRDELSAPLAAPLPPPPGTMSAHDWANRLNRVSLALHLIRRQREAGLVEKAEASLTRLFKTLDEIDREIETARARSSAPPPPPTCRALLVEDDANERELLAGLLQMGGCSCDSAADGEEALHYLASHERPDVVLLDLLLPRSDGRQTLAAIRNDPRLHDLRVFAVSGTPPESMGITTGPGGLDAWFPKPLNPRKLWDAITCRSRN